MQVVVNEAFLQRRRRFGQVGTVAGLSLLGVGFALSLGSPFLEIPGVDIQIPTVALSYLLLLPGLYIFNLGRYNAIRYGLRPTQDESVTAHLKGLDDRYHLYHFLPKLHQAPHFVVGPAGILVLHVRMHIGEVRMDGDRWWRPPGFGNLIRGWAEGSLGDPAREAQVAELALREHLRERELGAIADSLPISHAGLFLSPQVKLVIENDEAATVKVVLPRDLKVHARRTIGGAANPRQRLSDNDLAAVWSAFER